MCHTFKVPNSRLHIVYPLWTCCKFTGPFCVLWNVPTSCQCWVGLADFTGNNDFLKMWRETFQTKASLTAEFVFSLVIPTVCDLVIILKLLNGCNRCSLKIGCSLSPPPNCPSPNVLCVPASHPLCNRGRSPESWNIPWRFWDKAAFLAFCLWSLNLGVGLCRQAETGRDRPLTGSSSVLVTGM